MSKVIVEHEEKGALKALVRGAPKNEKKIITTGIRKTMDNIKEFENRYKIDSASFYQRYSNGGIGRRNRIYQQMRRRDRNIKKASTKS